MDLEGLLNLYKVEVQGALNDLGLVKIGSFRSRLEAFAFVEDAREIPGIHVPKAYNPVWPPDAEPCEVHINIGADYPLFLQLSNIV